MIEPKMVEYPVNYKKPDLVNFVANYIIDCGDVEDWQRYDLGEYVVEDIIEAGILFDPSDAEYAMLCTLMDDFIKNNLSESIEKELAERVESAKEWDDAKRSAIYE